jgi:hypothetical protein
MSGVPVLATLEISEFRDLWLARQASSRSVSHSREYLGLQSLIDTIPAVFYSRFFLVEVRKP